MSRPRPLVNLSSAVPLEQHQLTPRTPRTASGSRTSRLEQGFAKVQLSDVNEADFDDDRGALQSAPLLASSSTARFSSHIPRSRPSPIDAKDGKKRKTISASHMLSRLPLAVGVFIAGILLILIVLSLTRPEDLHRYIGTKPPNADLPSNAIPSSGMSSAKPDTGHETEGLHLISYDNYTTFPLQPIDYLRECAKMHQGYMKHGDYWDISFMGAMDVHHADDPAICSRTITYMLDGIVGLTADLALMAQAAALARERNRTFFVDDTYWNRGKWIDHFEDVSKLQPGPQPGCKPPPSNELVACPRTARHWVINSRTAKFHFGHGFSNHYENPYAHELNRLKPIFKSAQESFASTIVPNSVNKDLIKLARQKLLVLLSDVNQRPNHLHLPFVSTHIRRGDRKTLSYSFPDRSIPIQSYVDAIKLTWSRLHSDNALPVVYLATDSPEVHQDFTKLYHGVVFSLFDTHDPRLHALASPREYYQEHFARMDLQTRITATRGMIVDLAVLSGLWPSEDVFKPDAVICALSSSVCRLAPIGMGWETAFGHVDEMGNMDQENDRWVEIDQKGFVLPVWEAFELF